MLLFRAEIHKMLVRIENREDPGQTASDLSLHCLSRPLWQSTSVWNFRTITIKAHFGMEYSAGAEYD